MTTNIRLMLVLTRLHVSFLNNLGQDLEGRGMSSTIYPILAHLNNMGRSKTQKLGDVAMISSGTITHTVNKLCQLNYVNKIQDEKDKRITWVEITEEGRTAFKKVHIEHQKYLDSLLEDIKEDEKESLIKQMKYFGKKIEKKSND